MVNLYDKIVANPKTYSQLNCGASLITIYNCPLEDKFQDVWSRHNYIVYVKEGRKIWHTTDGSYDLKEGTIVLVRKGACIVEQFFDVTFCLVVFFITDDFICEVLKTKSTPIHSHSRKFKSIIDIEANASLKMFYQSMMPYFNANQTPDQSLLQLKFRELILSIADNPSNVEVLSYFCSLLKQPKEATLQMVMEENFCFNLKLFEFAKLSSRSLSAFKRDFLKVYNTPPGKWLMEKRLDHALHLLTNLNRTVAESAFESGFESASHFSRAFRDRFGRSPVSVRHGRSPVQSDGQRLMILGSAN